MWGADRKFCHEGNCSVPRGQFFGTTRPNRYSEWLYFQFAAKKERKKKHIHTKKQQTKKKHTHKKTHYGFVFLYILRGLYLSKNMCFFFYQFYAKICKFRSRNIRFGSSSQRHNIIFALNRNYSFCRPSSSSSSVIHTFKQLFLQGQSVNFS